MNNYNQKYGILKEYFGYTTFRGGQEQIIDAVLGGRNTLGIMPTGAGKSICFQIPALIFKGITIVVSPLISLMKDQVEALIQNGIKAAYINSSMSYAQIQKVLYNASYGMYKMIYVTPERLCGDEFMNFSMNTDISMLTIDEAHCVSQWGNDFRPSYLRIAEYYKALPYKPVISAFTATATDEVKGDIISSLEMKDPFVFTSGFDRSNLYFSVEKPDDKFAALTNIIKRNAGKCGIVYCGTRKNVDEVYERLCENGFSAARYHAGMTDDDRKNSQNDFIYDRKNIMVATNAFGMGIDKSNVSFVVHYNMPKDMESYYQEAGRAGRDGEPAECIILYGKSDVRLNQYIIENGERNEEIDDFTREEIRRRDMDRLKKMTFYCTITGCLRRYILKYFGEESENYCGSCGNCDGNYETADITVDSQKIISCIIRAKQRFGVNVIISVLRGSRSERIINLGLDKLTTYGIMKDKHTDYIREVMEHLEYKGYIFSSKDKYPVLKVSEKSREILKGEKTLIMKTVHKERDEIKPVNITNREHDRLYDELRRIRTNIALEQRMPAYIIFSDASLSDMCARLPRNEKEFLEVSGVGERKLELYGKYFIEAVNNYISVNNISDRTEESESAEVRLLREAAEAAGKVKTEEKATITQLCRNITEAAGKDRGINKLRDCITGWLLNNEYLREEKNYRGVTVKRAGRLCEQAGIFEEKREGAAGQIYYNVYYNEAGQRFILDSFDLIIEYYKHI
ncbi:MAG: DNA helicase RecQ [Oscillospiraceae bacterium]|nr:DNA helicase RecQ [Oscillospiraceae bacterium]